MEFIDKYSFALTGAIYEEFIRPRVKPESRWKFLNRKSRMQLLIGKHPEQSYPDYYIEVYRVAHLLYENRIELREIRKETNRSLDEYQPQDLPVEGLVERTREIFALNNTFNPKDG